MIAVEGDEVRLGRNGRETFEDSPSGLFDCDFQEVNVLELRHPCLYLGDEGSRVGVAVLVGNRDIGGILRIRGGENIELCKDFGNSAFARPQTMCWAVLTVAADGGTNIEETASGMELIVDGFALATSKGDDQMRKQSF